jgi:hypothetical protein
MQLRDAVEVVNLLLSSGGAKQVGLFCFVSDGLAKDVELSMGCMFEAGGLCLWELLICCC